MLTGGTKRHLTINLLKEQERLHKGFDTAAPYCWVIIHAIIILATVMDRKQCQRRHIQSGYL